MTRLIMEQKEMQKCTINYEYENSLTGFGGCDLGKCTGGFSPVKYINDPNYIQVKIIKTL